MPISRRSLLGGFIGFGVVGCRSRPAGTSGRWLATWGSHGLIPGRFAKPRAIAFDPKSQSVFVVDMNARIQSLSLTGEPITEWRTPTHANGRPSGLGVDASGNVLVADSHYHQILIYSPTGKLQWKLGGDETGADAAPLAGSWGYVGDVTDDGAGGYYVAEAIQNERITHCTKDGTIHRQWGGRGADPGQFQRPRSLILDRRGRLLVADACNHRVQIFDRHGTFVAAFGAPGAGPGELMYPYDVDAGADGSIYVCEFGNHRIQRFSADLQPLGWWGGQGRLPGQLHHPWALAVDHQERVLVVDSNNHRIQVMTFV